MHIKLHILSRASFILYFILEYCIAILKIASYTMNLRDILLMLVFEFKGEIL